MTSTGDLRYVRQGGEWITPTPAMDITGTSSLISELGDILAAVDIHINTLTESRKQLHKCYMNLVVLVHGLTVPGNWPSDD